MDIPYAAIVARLRDGVAILDEQARITHTNARLSEALGYRNDELIGRPIAELLDETDRRDFARRWALREKGEAGEYEVVYLRRDGSRMIARVLPQPILGEDGSFQGALGIITDITDQRNVEQFLQRRTRELAARAQGLACLRRIARIRADDNDTVAGKLQRIAQILPSGWDPSDAVSAQITYGGAAYRSAEFTRTPQRLAVALQVAGRSVGTVAVFYRNGAATKEPFPSYERELISEVAFDIGRYIDGREVSDTLAVTEKILRTSPALLYRAGTQRPWPITFLHGNAAHFGYTIEELRDEIKALEPILMPGEADRIEADAKGFLSRGVRQFTRQYRIRAKDGSPRSIGDSTAVLVDADGVARAFEGIIVDITEHHDMLARHKRALVQTVEALAAGHEKRDSYTAGHQARVAELAVLIGRGLGLSPDRIQGLYLGALIHDIGKLSVPAEILVKPSRLSDAEYELVKVHSRAGWDIVKNVDLAWPVATMVLQHHERLDGTGYPDGIKGDAIILESRIVAIADVVDAMFNPRPFRAALGIDAVLEELTSQRGRAFDPDAVDVCVRILSEKKFPLIAAVSATAID